MAYLPEGVPCRWLGFGTAAGIRAGSTPGGSVVDVCGNGNVLRRPREGPDSVVVDCGCWELGELMPSAVLHNQRTEITNDTFYTAAGHSGSVTVNSSCSQTEFTINKLEQRHGKHGAGEPVCMYVFVILWFINLDSPQSNHILVT